MQSANLLYKKVQNKHGKQLNFMYHLTNREALTALFSCKARRKRLKQEKSVGSVECSSRFLNRTEHNQGFSICFIIKNTLNSPSITFNFKKNFTSKANNSVVSMLYTLIKHATISQSESLLEWFK